MWLLGSYETKELRKRIQETSKSYCDTPLSGQPWLINFFKLILFMASDSSSGFHRGISHFFTATKNTTKRVEGRTNEQYGLGSVPSARKGVLWRFCAAFRAFVDYRGRVFCAKLLQKLLGMPTHFWQSSRTATFCWTSVPWTPLSAASLRLPSSTHLLSFLGPSSPRPLLVSRKISSSSPLFWFCAKSDKEIFCLAHTPT